MTLDWLQTPTGLIDETNELVTAFLVALGSDAAAAASDVLPDPRSDDRRGWWGDLNAAAIWNGWPLGSKLWLLTRAKILDAAARSCGSACEVLTLPTQGPRSMYACHPTRRAPTSPSQAAIWSLHRSRERHATIQLRYAPSRRSMINPVRRGARVRSLATSPRPRSPTVRSSSRWRGGLPV